MSVTNSRALLMLAQDACDTFQDDDDATESALRKLRTGGSEEVREEVMRVGMLAVVEEWRVINAELDAMDEADAAAE